MELGLTIFFGSCVGLALGLTGGGGSIFAVPLLIYGLSMPPGQAIPLSLAAVALTAGVGAAAAVRTRAVVWQPTVVFVAGGIIGAPLGISIAPYVPEQWIVLGFAAFALVVGATMFRRSRAKSEQFSVVRAQFMPTADGPVCRLSDDGQLRFSTRCALVLVLAGLVTGLLSGFFGVGGGFLIVPALMLITQVGIHRAVATSLVIITFIGCAGSVAAFLQGRIAFAVLIPFVIGGALGMIIGRLIAQKTSAAKLQRFFAATIVLVGVGMLFGALL